jgi:hypothetical protein
MINVSNPTTVAKSSIENWIGDIPGAGRPGSWTRQIQFKEEVIRKISCYISSPLSKENAKILFDTFAQKVSQLNAEVSARSQTSSVSEEIEISSPIVFLMPTRDETLFDTSCVFINLDKLEELFKKKYQLESDERSSLTGKGQRHKCLSCTMQ